MAGFVSRDLSPWHTGADELFFFGAGKLLYVPFPAHGFFLGGEAFEIDQSDRKTGPGIFTAGPVVMCLNSFFKIICPAAVVAAVGTLKNVSVIHDYYCCGGISCHSDSIGAPGPIGPLPGIGPGAGPPCIGPFCG